MAEFSKIAHDFLRMCDYYKNPPCQSCPMEIYGIDLDTCRARLLDNPEKYEMRIIQWAKEHPEPNYPTWAEWLYEQGLMTDVIDGKGGNFLYNLASKPMPADIAQKLGIEPKER